MPGALGRCGTIGFRSSGAGLRGFVTRLHYFGVGLRVFGFGFRARRKAPSPVTFGEIMNAISKT